MLFKMCPKCGGDLCSRREINGIDLVCMQCGFMREISPEEERLITSQRKKTKQERVAA